MSSIMKNGQQFAGVPKEVITAWEPSSNDKVVVKSTSIQSIVDIIYPVGSIYMSVNSTSPAVLFGGAWTQLENKMLIGAGSEYENGDTGGSATHTPEGTLSGGAVGDHTLTVAEMPQHTHSYLKPTLQYGSSNETTGNITPQVNSSGSGTTGGFYSDRWSNTALRSVNNTGGGGTHNHPFTQPTFTGTAQDTMPPYLAVYMWKRTA